MNKIERLALEFAIGNKFKSWTIIEKIYSEKQSSFLYKCRCDCSSEVYFRGSKLRIVRNGCKKCHINNVHDISRARIEKEDQDMIGKTFGEWTVIDRLAKRTFKTLCSCGSLGMVMKSDLKAKKSTKCTECYNKIKYKNRRTHGKTETKAYKVWTSILYRCLNESSKDFKHYGGRGITVDESWRIFSNFYEDMGDVPDGLQIDRIDNSKGYSKENCRWVTPKENCNNRRPKGSSNV